MECMQLFSLLFNFEWLLVVDCQIEMRVWTKWTNIFTIILVNDSARQSQLTRAIKWDIVSHLVFCFVLIVILSTGSLCIFFPFWIRARRTQMYVNCECEARTTFEHIIPDISPKMVHVVHWLCWRFHFFFFFASACNHFMIGSVFVKVKYRLSRILLNRKQ